MRHRIQLSDHFTYKKLIRYVIAPVIMMVFSSMYSIVDGFFVSNYVGKTPFAAVNLIMPILMGLGSIGYMLGTGGSAIVAQMLGEGKHELANRYFSMLIYVTAGVSLFLSIIGFVYIRQISSLLGAEDELLEYCVVYGRILFVSQTGFILQNVFQSFFPTAEKPGLSLKISVAAGLSNIILDYLFIAVLQMGIAGAALATAIGQFIGGIIPLVYFAGKNSSLLRLTKTSLHGRILFKACTNGSSEMVTNLSASVINILYNFQLMKLAGENGVAAYGVIMYVNFIFMAVFLGYSIGSAPLVSYHYGAGNQQELKNLFQKGLFLMGTSGFILMLLAELSSSGLVTIFASYDADLFAMTCRGFRLYSLAFIVMGVNVWGSSFFTALGDGAVSAFISFFRTFLFQIAAILLLPYFFGLDGIWLAIVAAELLALILTLVFFAAKRNRYHYA